MESANFDANLPFDYQFLTFDGFPFPYSFPFEIPGMRSERSEPLSKDSKGRFLTDRYDPRSDYDFAR